MERRSPVLCVSIYVQLYNLPNIGSETKNLVYLIVVFGLHADICISNMHVLSYNLTKENAKLTRTWALKIFETLKCTASAFFKPCAQYRQEICNRSVRK